MLQQRVDGLKQTAENQKGPYCLVAFRPRPTNLLYWLFVHKNKHSKKYIIIYIYIYTNININHMKTTCKICRVYALKYVSNYSSQQNVQMFTVWSITVRNMVERTRK